MRAGCVVPSNVRRGKMMFVTILLISGQLMLAVITLLQGETSDFKDLGKMLIGGFILAVAAGVAFTVVRLRLRDKKPLTAQIISISSPPAKDR